MSLWLALALSIRRRARLRRAAGRPSHESVALRSESTVNGLFVVSDVLIRVIDFDPVRA